MSTRAVILGVCSLIAVGCGSQVESESAAAASGGAGTSSAEGSGGAGGVSGEGGSLAVGGGGWNQGGGPPCADKDSFIDVLGDGDTKHFVLGYPEASVPWGRLIAGVGNVASSDPSPPPTPPPPDPMPGLVEMEGISNGNAGIRIFEHMPAILGTGYDGFTRYETESATYETTTDATTVTITTFGEVEHAIEGSFSADVTLMNGGGGPSKLVISGTFRVCRIPDLYLP
jgi:hypothetical protein